MSGPVDGGALRVCSVAYTHYRSDPRVRREAEALAERGDDVTVLSLREHGRPKVDDVEGVRVIGFSIERNRSNDLLPYVTSYARFFASAAAHLTRRPRSYDLVHVHSLPEALVFAAAAPKLGGRPVLLDVHDLSTEVFASRIGSTPRPVRLAERLALAFADHVVTVHDDYRDRVHQRGVDCDDITVVLNSPDDRRFPLRSPHTPRQPPRLIYHGTFVARYGLEVALRAVAAARERVPGISLELVGDGDFRPEVVRLVDELDLAGCVHLSPGAVPIDELAAHIATADVGLAPFIDDQFTQAILPTKMLEYTMGLPVIVSRNPVIERYFGDDDVYFVEPGSTEQLAAAIQAIAGDPRGAARRAERAQRFFATEGWPVAKKRFLAMVDEMVDGRDAR